MSLPRRELILLECANALGGVSNALAMVAIPWLILERSGSAAAAGLAAALAALPAVLVSPVVGVIVDRVGRKAVSVASDLLSAVSVLLFPLLDSLGQLSLVVIFALTLLGAAFDPAGYTARKALIPDVARASGIERDTVNGLHEGVFMAGWVIGPVIGAFGIATFGPVATLGAAGGVFLCAAVAVVVMTVPNRVPASPGEATSRDGSALVAARAGLRALMSDRPVWILTLTVAAIWLIYMPTESVLLPVHFEATDQAAAFGWVISAMAAGAMIGAFGYGWISRRLSLYHIALLSAVVVGATYLPVALLPPPVLMVLPAFFLGLAWGPMEPLLNTVVQDRFPDDQHGSVYGVQLAIFSSAPPLGQLLSGVAVERLGVEPVFLTIAGALILVPVAIGFLPVLRGLDADPSKSGEIRPADR